MSGGSRRGEDVLPIFDAPEPDEVEEATSAGRMGRPGFGPGRGAGIAAALLVFLVAGIVVGGLSSDPRPSPTSAPETGDVTCRPQSVQNPAQLALSAQTTGGTVAGLFGVSFSSADPVPSIPAWLGPPRDGALEIGSLEGVEIQAGPFACITRLVVTYLAADSTFNGGAGDPLIDRTVEPAAHAVGFGGMAAGDWVLRVEAHFMAQDHGAGVETLARWFFRVIVINGFAPTPAASAPPATPAVTPMRTCAITPASADLQVIAAAGAGDVVIGGTAPFSEASPKEAPTMSVNLGDRVEISIPDGRCAVSWSIRLIDPSSLSENTIEFQRNDNGDPAFASQNAWGVPFSGTGLLLAHLDFADGLTIDRTWLLVGKPFEIPAAFLVAADGTRREALAGCGLSISLSNGYNTSDQCGGAGVSLGPAALHLAAGTPITFDIPGWEIRSWRAVCGGLSGESGDLFTETDGCNLGGALSDTGEPLPDPARFVLAPADTVVVIEATAVSPNRDSFSVPYYIHVIAK